MTTLRAWIPHYEHWHVGGFECVRVHGGVKNIAAKAARTQQRLTVCVENDFLTYGK